MNHRRLYVGDLGSEITEENLRKLFEQAGYVEAIQLTRSNNHALHGFAFIEMETPEEARLAVQKFNGYTLDGSRLIVYTVPPRTRPRNTLR